MSQIDARTSSIGNDNVASAATDRRADSNSEGVLLQTADATEKCLNQGCMAGDMRHTAQSALNASIAVGCGPDMQDQDGLQ